MNWLLKESSSKHRVSQDIYLGLWIIALGSAGYYYYLLQHSRLLGFGGFMSLLFGAMTLAQQCMVYYDVHKIEDNLAAAKEEYGEWVNTHLERFGRYLIFSALLLGAGKVAGVIHPMLQCTDAIGMRASLCEVFEPEGVSERNLFVFGAQAVFGALAGWNIAAFVYWVGRLRKAVSQKLQAKERIHLLIIGVRIVAFLISVILCLVYWYFVWSGRLDQNGNFATVFIVIYGALVTAVVALKSQRVVGRVVRGIVMVCCD